MSEDTLIFAAILEDALIMAGLGASMWALANIITWVCQLFAKPATHHPNGWQRLDRTKD